MAIKRTRIRTEIFSREDIDHILAGIDSANEDLAEQVSGREVKIYQAGFGAALKAIRRAFDIKSKK